jgi:G3E family GTPase
MGRSSPYLSVAEERRRARGEGPARPAVPFFILTGFLGAGKTTLVNRLLSAPQGRRIAVLVNDVGQINIDRALIQAEAGDLIELSGGCVCCQVDLQRDLFSGVDDLIERARPDVVLLETTGIADPSVLLHAFLADAERTRSAIPSGVACALDAEIGIDGETRPEWRAQVAAADRLVLTKVDRAAAERVSALHARLRELRPEVERAAFPPGEAGDQALARYLLAGRPSSRAPARTTAHAHAQLSVCSYDDEAALLEAPLRALLDELGPALVRAKGWARVLAGREARWTWIEVAGRMTVLEPRDPPAGRDRAALVFLVEAQAISEEALRRRLWACGTRSPPTTR